MPSAFRQGWQFFADAAQSGMSARSGQSYCADVENAIETLTKDMYEIVEAHGSLGVGQCKGFTAEVWHADTFNINAVLKGSEHRAFIDKSTDFGSVDVSTNFDRNFSMKYMGSAKLSADAQAKNYYEAYQEYYKKPRKSAPMTFEEYLQRYEIENDPELLKSVYSGQYRVIPKDQLEAATQRLRMLLKIEQGKDGANRALVYKNYLETLEKLTDKVTDGSGVESVSLDKETAEVIVRLCRESEFKAEDFGIDISKLVITDYIFQQALKAGYTAAVLSLVMEVSPKICEAILYLIKNGEADPNQFKELGFAALNGAALGFIRGYVSCALTIACQSGKLGGQFMNIQGNTVAAITVLVMNTVKNAFLVAAGKMTGREMSVRTEDAAAITVAALIGGSIGTALLPQLAVLGYMIGSFVGSVIGSIAAQGKNAFIMALCANTGITLFGIVDQNYSLSREMIDSLGLKTVDLKVNEPKKKELNYNRPKVNKLNRNELHTLDIFILKRGVVGVRRIGYV